MYSNLECMDLAATSTIDKYKDTVDDANLMYMKISASFARVILEHNLSGFTRDVISREQLQEIGIIGFKTELLKNIVKIMAYKRVTEDDDIKNIKGCDLENLENISSTKYPIETIVEVEIFNRLIKSLNSDQDIYEIYRLLNDPYVIKYVSRSFVNSRYKKNIRDSLENALGFDNECQHIIEVLDAFYEKTKEPKANLDT